MSTSPTPAAPSPLRVTRLAVTNYRRIAAVEITPGERTLTILQGPNEQGKTSVIDALAAALGGKRRSPEVPIRRGEESAIVEVELSDELRARYQVQRSWAGDKSYLHVYALQDDGTRAKVTAGQTLLDQLVSDVSFDPLAFARAGNDQKGRQLQARMLCAAIGRPDLLEQAEARKAAIAEQRRQVNQQVATAEARLGVDPAPGEELAEVTAADVQAELDKAEAHNAKRRGKQQEVDKAKAEVDRARGQVQMIEAQIAELQRKREEWATYAAQQEQVAGDAAAALAAMPPEISTAELTARVEEVQAHNARAKQQADFRRRQQQLAELAGQAAALTEQLRAVDAEVEAQIAASDLGKAVPGLTFRDGQLFHNGVPFSQASGMRRLELSALIGMAANPSLRILTIDEGDQLDDESLARLRQLAAERGYQLWMTAIRAGDEHDPDTLIVPIRNGQVKTLSPSSSNGQAAAAVTVASAKLATEPGCSAAAPVAVSAFEL